jgi:two-component system, NarL family, nitrate/nitrite response regulator NarL
MSLTLSVDAGRKTTSVLIVEDHRVVGEGLEAVLRLNGFAPVISACESADDIMEEARTLAPDLVILDLQLDKVGDGYDLIRPLLSLGTNVLVLTGVTDRIQLALCFEAGAIGVVSKAGSFSGLLEQVERAAGGEAVTSVTERAAYAEELRQHRVAEKARTAPFEALTRREADVLGMIVEGMSAAEMARESYVSLPTVRTQIRSIFQKLCVNSQLEAAAMARALGWEPPGR